MIIYLLLAVLGLCCCVGFSVVVMSRGSSLVVAHRLLIAVVSLVAEHGLQGMQASGVTAPRFQSAGSVVVAHGLRYPEASGIFPDQGLNLCLLHWHVDSLPLSYKRSLLLVFWPPSLLHSVSVAQSRDQSSTSLLPTVFSVRNLNIMHSVLQQLNLVFSVSLPIFQFHPTVIIYQQTLTSHPVYPPLAMQMFFPIRNFSRTSHVAQWIRICLPMQRT